MADVVADDFGGMDGWLAVVFIEGWAFAIGLVYYPWYSWFRNLEGPAELGYRYEMPEFWLCVLPFSRIGISLSWVLGKILMLKK